MLDPNDLLAHYNNPDTIASYANGPQRYVPGLADLHRMTGILLAERVPEAGNVLVLGAGGGMELKALAESHDTWRFHGVDPSAQMLTLAEKTLGALASRVTFNTGYIDDAPAGPFDGAVCLLTLHFLPPDERQRTIAEVCKRLKPGAPFVTAHSSFPQTTPARARWLQRYAAFAVASGEDPDKAEMARAAVDGHLNLLSPAQDEAALTEGGFTNVEQFYAAFTWRGWVGYTMTA